MKCNIPVSVYWPYIPKQFGIFIFFWKTDPLEQNWKYRSSGPHTKWKLTPSATRIEWTYISTHFFYWKLLFYDKTDPATTFYLVTHYFNALWIFFTIKIYCDNILNMLIKSVEISYDLYLVPVLSAFINYSEYCLMSSQVL